MLLAIVIFLSLPAVGKTEDYLLSEGTFKEGEIDLREDVARAWMRGVQQAFYSVWAKMATEKYEPYSAIVRESRMKEEFKKILLEQHEIPVPTKVEYDRLVEDGTFSGLDLKFEISKKLEEDEEVRKVVRKELQENFKDTEHSGWIEEALEHFAKALSKEDAWLGVGCTLEDNDVNENGNFTAHCYFKGRDRDQKVRPLIH